MSTSFDFNRQNAGRFAGAVGATFLNNMFRWARPLNSQQRRDSRNRIVGRRGRRAGGRAMTYRRRKKTRSTRGILGGVDADTKMIYAKKRMPRIQRKRWTSFVRKVAAAKEKDLGTRTVLFNDQITQYNNVGANQSCLTLALYGFVNATNLWLDDLNQIGQMENEANPTAAAGATIDKNTKILFQSGILDLTLRNVSTIQNQDGTNALASDAALELDIYEVQMRKEPGAEGSAAANWSSITRILQRYDDPQIGGAGTDLAIQDRGATPFEFGAQMGRAGVRIMKKTKFFIPNGQTITWQLRDPKRHVCRYGDLETNDGWVRPGWTKVYYLIYKLVPGLTQGSTPGTYRAGITIGLTKKYAYKVEGFNEPRERLVGASYIPAAQE